MQAGFVKLRRGIIEHLPDRITPDEFVVFLYILLSADFRTGAWIGSGNEIAKRVHIRKRYAQLILLSLRTKGYVEFEIPPEHNQGYPIHIPKYYGGASPGPVGPRGVHNGTQQKAEMYLMGPSNAKQGVQNQAIKPSEEVILRKKPKPPLPPLKRGAQFFDWCGERIEVEMGRRKRMPSLESYTGARAMDVVNFLIRRGFQARVQNEKLERSRH